MPATTNADRGLAANPTRQASAARVSKQAHIPGWHIHFDSPCPSSQSRAFDVGVREQFPDLRLRAVHHDTHVLCLARIHDRRLQMREGCNRVNPGSVSVCVAPCHPEHFTAQARLHRRQTAHLIVLHWMWVRKPHLSCPVAIRKSPPRDDGRPSPTRLPLRLAAPPSKQPRSSQLPFQQAPLRLKIVSDVLPGDIRWDGVVNGRDIPTFLDQRRKLRKVRVYGLWPFRQFALVYAA